jgi:hypothetical protein
LKQTRQRRGSPPAGRVIMTPAPTEGWTPALVDPDPRQQIRFCTTPAGVRVAYATAGRGPALAVPAAWIGNLELAWQDPTVRAFYGPLAAQRTLVRYDKPDCGLSDPWPGRQTLRTSSTSWPRPSSRRAAAVSSSATVGVSKLPSSDAGLGAAAPAAPAAPQRRRKHRRSLAGRRPRRHRGSPWETP